MSRFPRKLNPPASLDRPQFTLAQITRLLAGFEEQECEHKTAKKLGPCWVWKGHKDSKGYGQFWFGARAHWVHRLMYALFCRSLKEGQQVDHRCVNPSCGNPRHLRPMTHSQNSADANSRRAAVPF